MKATIKLEDGTEYFINIHAIAKNILIPNKYSYEIYKPFLGMFSGVIDYESEDKDELQIGLLKKVLEKVIE